VGVHADAAERRAGAGHHDRDRELQAVLEKGRSQVPLHQEDESDAV
jgi:hypothetical protein